MPLCLTLSIIRYGSRVKWSNPGKGVAPSPTSWCCNYQKGSLRVTLDYSRQLYLLISTKGSNSCMWERQRNRGLLWLTSNGDRHIQSPTSFYFFDRNFDIEPVLSHGVTSPLFGWCLLAGCSLNDWPPISLGLKNFCIIYFLNAHTFFLLTQFT